MPRLKKGTIRRQVAALPIMVDTAGHLRVMLITSRDTQRRIIPKGWPMKGRKDHHAAATEAREEAGLIGRVHRKPIGTYSYWKRLPDHFVYCKVKVYLLEVSRQLKTWREQGERRGAWLLVEDAAELVDEPGLVTLIRDLPDLMREKAPRTKPAA